MRTIATILLLLLTGCATTVPVAEKQETTILSPELTKGVVALNKWKELYAEYLKLTKKRKGDILRMPTCMLLLYGDNYVVPSLLEDRTVDPVLGLTVLEQLKGLRRGCKIFEMPIV